MGARGGRNVRRSRRTVESGSRDGETEEARCVHTHAACFVWPPRGVVSRRGCWPALCNCLPFTGVTVFRFTITSLERPIIVAEKCRRGGGGVVVFQRSVSVTSERVRG